MAGYPLYAGYTLANSQSVPMFQGSTNPEMLSVMQHNQGMYDTASAGANSVDESLDNITALPWDKDKAEALRQSVQDKLTEFSKRGDYENLVPAVQQLGSEAGKRMQELAAPVKQRQDFISSLDNKDLDLNPDQKRQILAMSDYGYQQRGGLQQDQYGRYVGSYQGMDVAKNVDLVKKTHDIMEGYADSKQGTLVEAPDKSGMWLMKNGQKVEELSPDRVREIVGSALDNDQEYQGYLGMQRKLASFQGAQDWKNPSVYPDTVPGMVQKYDAKGQPMKDKNNQPVMVMGQVPNSDKQYILDQAVKTGRSYQDIAGALYAAREDKRINGNELNFAIQKYAHRNTDFSQEMTADPYGLEQYKKKLNDTANPYQIQGPDSKVTSDEADLDKLQANTRQLDQQYSDLSSHLNMLNNRLKSSMLSPTAKAQVQADITATQEQLGDLNQSRNRANEISDYSKMKTAQSMGYGNYEEFRDSQSKPIEATIRKTAGGTFKADDGTIVSAQDIAKALVDGKVHTNSIATGAEGATGGGDFGIGPVMGTPQSQDGIKVTLPTGKIVTIKGDVGDKVNSVLQDATDKSRIGEFNDRWQKDHASNVKDYAISSNYVNLGEDDRKNLSNLLKAGAQGVKLTKPGDYNNEIAEGDRPATMEVTAVKGIAPDGKVTLAVQGYDKDKKPVGVYEATVSNSNIGHVLQEKWIKANVDGANPDAAAAAENIAPGSGASYLVSQPIGGTVDLGTHGGNKYTLSINRSGSRTYYQVIDKDGNVQQSKDGQKFQTTDIGEAGRWIDQFRTLKQ